MIIKQRKEVINSIGMDDVKFVPDDELLRKLQITLLGIYRDILTVCEERQIKAYLVGGSALGAVRHHGFIPWDDDLDIGMTRGDYEKFKKVFGETLSEKYMLVSPNFGEKAMARFPKVLKKGTRSAKVGGILEEKYQCVCVDIFIIESIPENKVCRLFKGIYCNFLEYISGLVFEYENWDESLELLYRRISFAKYLYRRTAGMLFSFFPASRWFDLVDRNVQYRGRSDYIGLPTGRRHYFGEIFKKAELLPETYIKFEDVKAPVFQGYDRYLSNLYGDYMKIPPVEKRERHMFKLLKLNNSAES